MSLLPRHASNNSVMLRNYTKVRCTCGVCTVYSRTACCLLGELSPPRTLCSSSFYRRTSENSGFGARLLTFLPESKRCQLKNTDQYVGTCGSKCLEHNQTSRSILINMNSTLPPQSIADQPSTSGRSSYAPAAALSEARYWSPSTPPAAEWREHWQNVIPELTELARSAICI